MFLFDLDGTILDSSSAILSAYRKSTRDILGYDLDPDAEHIHELLRRRPIEYFRQHYPPLAEDLARQYAAVYRSSGVRPFDGMPELLELLGERSKIGIVSNKGGARIHSDLQMVGISPERLSVIIAAEDTAKRKPHSDPILKALQALRWEGDTATYIGDGPHDVEAALAAGIRAVAVSWGYYPKTALRATNPTHLVHSVGDLGKILLGNLS